MNPHVSDEQITRSAESYADFEVMKNDGESYSTHLSGYEFGAKQTRDLYEPLVTSQADRIAALEEALRLLPIEAFNEDGEGADAADFPDNARHFVAAMDAARALLTPRPPNELTP